MALRNTKAVTIPKEVAQAATNNTANTDTAASRRAQFAARSPSSQVNVSSSSSPSSSSSKAVTIPSAVANASAQNNQKKSGLGALVSKVFTPKTVVTPESKEYKNLTSATPVQQKAYKSKKITDENGQVNVDSWLQDSLDRFNYSLDRYQTSFQSYYGVGKDTTDTLKATDKDWYNQSANQLNELISELTTNYGYKGEDGQFHNYSADDDLIKQLTEMANAYDLMSKDMDKDDFARNTAMAYYAGLAEDTANPESRKKIQDELDRVNAEIDRLKNPEGVAVAPWDRNKLNEERKANIMSLEEYQDILESSLSAYDNGVLVEQAKNPTAWARSKKAAESAIRTLDKQINDVKTQLFKLGPVETAEQEQKFTELNQQYNDLWAQRTAEQTKLDSYNAVEAQLAQEKKDAELAEIYTDEYWAEYEKETARLQKTLSEAKAARDEAQKKLDENAFSGLTYEDYDKLRDEYDAAQARYEEAQAAFNEHDLLAQAESATADASDAAKEARKIRDGKVRDLNTYLATLGDIPDEDDPTYQRLMAEVEAAEEDVKKASSNWKTALADEDITWGVMESYLANRADFEERAARGMALENKVLEKAAAVNGETENSNRASKAVEKGSGSVYLYMTEEQQKTYGFLLDYYGEDSEQAKEYLNYIDESLKTAKGMAKYKNLKAKHTNEMGEIQYLPALGVAFAGGLESVPSGIGQWFTDKPVAPSASQVATQMVSQSYAEPGQVDDGRTRNIKQFGLEASQTIGNMAPSIAASALLAPLTGGTSFAWLPEVVGAGLIGLSAGGNAMTQGLQSGLDPTQARVFGALSGAAEAGLQYVLGGVSSLGGVAADKLVGRLTAQAAAEAATTARITASSAIKRMVATGIVKGTSEAIEESLQSMMEPLFLDIAGSTADNRIDWSEVLYSALMAYVTVGFLEGGSIVASGYGYQSLPQMFMQQTLDRAHQGLDLANVEVLNGLNILSNVAEINPEAKALLDKVIETYDLKVDPNKTEYTAENTELGHFTEQVNALAKSELGKNVTELAKRVAPVTASGAAFNLMNAGMNTEMAYKVGDVMESVVSGRSIDDADLAVTAALLKGQGNINQAVSEAVRAEFERVTGVAIDTNLSKGKIEQAIRDIANDKTTKRTEADTAKADAQTRLNNVMSKLRDQMEAQGKANQENATVSEAEPAQASSPAEAFRPAANTATEGVDNTPYNDTQTTEQEEPNGRTEPAPADGGRGVDPFNAGDTGSTEVRVGESPTDTAESGTAYGGVTEEGRSDGRGDTGVSEEPVRNVNSKKGAVKRIRNAVGKDFAYANNVTKTASAYADALAKAKAKHKYGFSVDAQTEESLKASKAKVYMTENGDAGFGVATDSFGLAGNIIGVFSNPDGSVTNAAYSLMPQAVLRGGTHLDCFVKRGSITNLGRTYSQFGMVPVAMMEFDLSIWQADHPGEVWNSELMGEPYVVYFKAAELDPVKMVDEEHYIWSDTQLEQLVPFSSWEEVETLVPKLLNEDFIRDDSGSVSGIYTRTEFADKLSNSGLSAEEINAKFDELLERVKHEGVIPATEIAELAAPNPATATHEQVDAYVAEAVAEANMSPEAASDFAIDQQVQYFEAHPEEITREEAPAEAPAEEAPKPKKKKKNKKTTRTTQTTTETTETTESAIPPRDFTEDEMPMRNGTVLTLAEFLSQVRTSTDPDVIEGWSTLSDYALTNAFRDEQANLRASGHFQSSLWAQFVGSKVYDDQVFRRTGQFVPAASEAAETATRNARALAEAVARAGEDVRQAIADDWRVATINEDGTVTFDLSRLDLGAFARNMGFTHTVGETIKEGDIDYDNAKIVTTDGSPMTWWQFYASTEDPASPWNGKNFQYIRSLWIQLVNSYTETGTLGQNTVTTGYTHEQWAQINKRAVELAKNQTLNSANGNTKAAVPPSLKLNTAQRITLGYVADVLLSKGMFKNIELVDNQNMFGYNSLTGTLKLSTKTFSGGHTMMQLVNWTVGHEIFHSEVNKGRDMNARAEGQSGLTAEAKKLVDERVDFATSMLAQELHNRSRGKRQLNRNTSLIEYLNIMCGMPRWSIPEAGMQTYLNAINDAYIADATDEALAKIAEENGGVAPDASTERSVREFMERRFETDPYLAKEELAAFVTGFNFESTHTMTEMAGMDMARTYDSAIKLADLYQQFYAHTHRNVVYDSSETGRVARKLRDMCDIMVNSVAAIGNIEAEAVADGAKMTLIDPNARMGRYNAVAETEAEWARENYTGLPDRYTLDNNKKNQYNLHAVGILQNAPRFFTSQGLPNAPVVIPEGHLVENIIRGILSGDKGHTAQDLISQLPDIIENNVAFIMAGTPPTEMSKRGENHSIVLVCNTPYTAERGPLYITMNLPGVGRDYGTASAAYTEDNSGGAAYVVMSMYFKNGTNEALQSAEGRRITLTNEIRSRKNASAKYVTTSQAQYYETHYVSPDPNGGPQDAIFLRNTGNINKLMSDMGYADIQSSPFGQMAEWNRAKETSGILNAKNTNSLRRLTGDPNIQALVNNVQSKNTKVAQILSAPDSTIVDDNGQLITTYTPAFSARNAGIAAADYGLWSVPNDSTGYATQVLYKALGHEDATSANSVRSTLLNISQPYVVNINNDEMSLDTLALAISDQAKDFKLGDDNSYASIINWVKSKGFDGLQVDGVILPNTSVSPTTVYCAFSPHQQFTVPTATYTPAGAKALSMQGRTPVGTSLKLESFINSLGAKERVQLDTLEKRFMGSKLNPKKAEWQFSRMGRWVDEQMAAGVTHVTKDQLSEALYNNSMSLQAVRHEGATAQEVVQRGLDEGKIDSEHVADLADNGEPIAYAIPQSMKGSTDMAIYNELSYKGGTNYREYTFEEPELGLDDPNQYAGAFHWNRPNVVAHIREQDIMTDHGKAVMINEMQSDARAEYTRALKDYKGALDSISSKAGIRDTLVYNMPEGMLNTIVKSMHLEPIQLVGQFIFENFDILSEFTEDEDYDSYFTISGLIKARFGDDMNRFWDELYDFIPEYEEAFLDEDDNLDTNNTAFIPYDKADSVLQQIKDKDYTPFSKDAEPTNPYIGSDKYPELVIRNRIHDYATQGYDVIAWPTPTDLHDIEVQNTEGVDELTGYNMVYGEKGDAAKAIIKVISEIQGLAKAQGKPVGPKPTVQKIMAGSEEALSSDSMENPQVAWFLANETSRHNYEQNIASLQSRNNPADQLYAVYGVVIPQEVKDYFAEGGTVGAFALNLTNDNGELTTTREITTPYGTRTKMEDFINSLSAKKPVALRDLYNRFRNANQSANYQAEWDFANLDGWIEEQLANGVKQVSRDELLDALYENAQTMTEVMHQGMTAEQLVQQGIDEGYITQDKVDYIRGKTDYAPNAYSVPIELRGIPNGTSYDEMSLKGGENYREYTLRLSKYADYMPTKMRGHWNAGGVTAFCRMQDFSSTTGGTTALFLEAQSDAANDYTSQTKVLKDLLVDYADQQELIRGLSTDTLNRIIDAYHADPEAVATEYLSSNQLGDPTQLDQSVLDFVAEHENDDRIKLSISGEISAEDIEDIRSRVTDPNYVPTSVAEQQDYMPEVIPGSDKYMETLVRARLADLAVRGYDRLAWVSPTLSNVVENNYSNTKHLNFYNNLYSQNGQMAKAVKKVFNELGVKVAPQPMVVGDANVLDSLKQSDTYKQYGEMGLFNMIQLYQRDEISLNTAIDEIAQQVGLSSVEEDQLYDMVGDFDTDALQNVHAVYGVDIPQSVRDYFSSGGTVGAFALNIGGKVQISERTRELFNYDAIQHGWSTDFMEAPLYSKIMTYVTNNPTDAYNLDDIIPTFTEQAKLTDEEIASSGITAQIQKWRDAGRTSIPTDVLMDWVVGNHMTIREHGRGGRHVYTFDNHSEGTARMSAETYVTTDTNGNTYLWLQRLSNVYNDYSRDFVYKQLVRIAANEGYAGVAWSRGNGNIDTFFNDLSVSNGWLNEGAVKSVELTTRNTTETVNGFELSQLARDDFNATTMNSRIERVQQGERRRSRQRNRQRQAAETAQTQTQTEPPIQTATSQSRNTRGQSEQRRQNTSRRNFNTQRAQAETASDINWDTREADNRHDKRTSNVRSNTYEATGWFNKVMKDMMDLRNLGFLYDVNHEEQSMRAAAERLAADYEGEKKRLAGLAEAAGEGRLFWSASENDEAMAILHDAMERGDTEEVVKWSKYIQRVGTAAGQISQSFAKYNRTPEGALITALSYLDEADISDELRKDLTKQLNEFARTLEEISNFQQNESKQTDEDRAKQINALIDLIKRQAEVRNTKISKFIDKRLAKEIPADGSFKFLYDVAITQFMQIAQDYLPTTIGNKLATYQTIAHLLNLRTGMRNVLSNQVFRFIDTVANDVAMIPDRILSIFTGAKTVGLELDQLRGSAREARRTAGRRASIEASLDVDPRNQKDKYGTARRTWKMAGNRGSQFMSTLEKWMSYELNVTDDMSKGVILGDVMASIAPFIGDGTNGTITEEQAMAMAKQEMLYRTFQDNNFMSVQLGEIKNWLNSVVGIGDSGNRTSRGATIHDFGAGDFITKYTQVPGALIMRMVEYSPAGAVKALWNLAQVYNASKDIKNAQAGRTVTTRVFGEDGQWTTKTQKLTARDIDQLKLNALQAQRRAALQIGRFLTGAGLIALFSALSKSGILKRDDDDDDADVKAMNSSNGVTGTQLNLSAAMRWANQERDAIEWRRGDLLMGIDFLEPLNGLMTMGAIIAKDAASGEDLELRDYVSDSLQGLYNNIAELPVMTTLGTASNSLKYSTAETSWEKVGGMMIDVARGSLSGFIPAPVRQAAQAFDPYARDLYTETGMGPQTLDSIQNTIPGLREELPEKLTNFGEAKNNEVDSFWRVANAFAVPGSVRTYTGDALATELNRLYKATGEEGLVPGRAAPYTVTEERKKGMGPNDKFKLTAEERQQYQKTRGQLSKRYLNELIKSDTYKRASDEDKASMVKSVLSYTDYRAKAEAVRDNGGYLHTSTQEKVTDRVLNEGTSLSKFAAFATLKKGDSDNWETDGSAKLRNDALAQMYEAGDIDKKDVYNLYNYERQGEGEAGEKSDLAKLQNAMDAGADVPTFLRNMISVNDLNEGMGYSTEQNCRDVADYIWSVTDDSVTAEQLFRLRYNEKKLKYLWNARP